MSQSFVYEDHAEECLTIWFWATRTRRSSSGAEARPTIWMFLAISDAPSVMIHFASMVVSFCLLGNNETLSAFLTFRGLGVGVVDGSRSMLNPCQTFWKLVLGISLRLVTRGSMLGWLSLWQENPPRQIRFIDETERAGVWINWELLILAINASQLFFIHLYEYISRIVSSLVPSLVKWTRWVYCEDI